MTGPNNTTLCTWVNTRVHDLYRTVNIATKLLTGATTIITSFDDLCCYRCVLRSFQRRKWGTSHRAKLLGGGTVVSWHGNVKLIFTEERNLAVLAEVLDGGQRNAEVGEAT